MKEALVIVDMQNDFTDGSLANTAAKNIVPKICHYISNEFIPRIKLMHVNDNYNIDDFHIIMTRDTHADDYLKTPEGKKLPIEHCIEGTSGWCVNDDIIKTVRDSNVPYSYVDKITFGYSNWLSVLTYYNTLPDRIYICGTVTSICVISNALILKALCPNTEIIVLSDLCADMDDEGQAAALKVMRNCQIEVI